MGAATFNLFYSFLAGLLMFAGLYGFALWASDAIPRCCGFCSRRHARAADTTPASTSRSDAGGTPMVRLGRILRDYQDAGSLNSLLALWGFVDDTTFLTKAGHVGLVYRCAGVDHEGLTTPSVRPSRIGSRAALRLLDERCRVYQYLIKRDVRSVRRRRHAPHPVAHEAIQRRTAYLNARRDDLYQLDLYLVLLYEGLRLRRARARGCGTLWRSPRRGVAGVAVARPRP